jgi:hypothetical protein
LACASSWHAGPPSFAAFLHCDLSPFFARQRGSPSAVRSSKPAGTTRWAAAGDGSSGSSSASTSGTSSPSSSRCSFASRMRRSCSVSSGGSSGDASSVDAGSSGSSSAGGAVAALVGGDELAEPQGGLDALLGRHVLERLGARGGDALLRLHDRAALADAGAEDAERRDLEGPVLDEVALDDRPRRDGPAVRELDLHRAVADGQGAGAVLRLVGVGSRAARTSSISSVMVWFLRGLRSWQGGGYGRCCPARWVHVQ